MSEEELTVDDRLGIVRAQLAPLLKRKRELDDQVRMLIPLGRNHIGDGKFNEIHAELEPLNGWITLLRQEEVSLLTERLGRITERLDTSVQTLYKSSEAQLKVTESLTSIEKTKSDTTKRLEESSERLVFLTGFLLILTAITLMDNFLSGSLNHAFLSLIVGLTVVVMAFYWTVSVVPPLFRKKNSPPN